MSEKRAVTVLVKYQTLQGKTDTALAHLKSLIHKVSAEPYYGSIHCFTGKDPLEILLIEKWMDEHYYLTDHMKTDHLQAFITSSGEFLSGPPEIAFWYSANTSETV